MSGSDPVEWNDRLQPYVAEWANASDHVVTEERPHDAATLTV